MSLVGGQSTAPTITTQPRSQSVSLGAKVRVRATIHGTTQSQLRVISGGRSGNQDDLRAAFGLGDATVADSVRIEWPSGLIQEWRGVQANQFLTVTEPAQLSVSAAGNNRCRLEWLGGKGHRYAVEQSGDLLHWQTVATVTNRNRRVTWTNSASDGSAFHFYRAVDSTWRTP